MIRENFDKAKPICCIVCAGTTGTGKSTLLNTIANFLNPTIDKQIFETSGGVNTKTQGCWTIPYPFSLNKNAKSQD